MYTHSENFPNLVKEMDMRLQETQVTPNKMNTPKFTPGYIYPNPQTSRTKGEF